MEAFTLLKYWRTNAGAGSSSGEPTLPPNARATTKTIVAPAAAVSSSVSEGEDSHFFDLEFALTDDDSENDGDAPPPAESQDNDKRTQKTDESESGSDSEETSDNEEGEEELKFAIAGDDCAEQNVALSPSDELFFKGNLVPIEPSTILLSGSEENNKFPVFLMKSATKFRVLLLKLKKSKSGNGVLEKSENIEANTQEISEISKNQEKQGKLEEKQGRVSGKFFTVKFKVEEVKVPLVSLFTRDNSSKENHGKVVKNAGEDSDWTAASDDRRLTKEVVQKYLNKVKPLYVRVSKRYVQKLKFPGHLSFPGGGSKGCVALSAAAERGGEVAAPSSGKIQLKQGNINNNFQAGLKVVKKHLGKSRSASATVAADPPGKTASNRRDDSLLQLQDGIQGAILHCKKSFNASRGGESSSILCRSVSDPSHEKSVTMTTVSAASTSSSCSGIAKAEVKV